MKFRFCGDLDCPDWVLAEIATLSKLSSLRVKMLAAQVIIHSISGDFSYEKVVKLAGENSDGMADLKGAISALHFILCNSAKFDLDELSLVQEVQQLGLPKENSDVLGKLYLEKKEDLRKRFAVESYSLPKLLSVDWRLDTILTSSNSGSCNVANLKLSLDVRPQDDSFNNMRPVGATTDDRYKELAFEMSAAQLNNITDELNKAYQILNSLDL